METASSPALLAARLQAIDRELVDRRRELRLLRRCGFAENIKVMQIVVLELERQRCITAVRTGDAIDFIPVADHIALAQSTATTTRPLVARFRPRPSAIPRLRAGDSSPWLRRVRSGGGYVALGFGLVLCALRAALIARPSKRQPNLPERRDAFLALRRGRPLPPIQSGDVAVPHTGPLF